VGRKVISAFEVEINKGIGSDVGNMTWHSLRLWRQREDPPKNTSVMVMRGLSNNGDSQMDLASTTPSSSPWSRFDWMTEARLARHVPDLHTTRTPPGYIYHLPEVTVCIRVCNETSLVKLVRI